jgi:Arc/MetJ-type ribon-helix-helix transcriptional regulator
MTKLSAKSRTINISLPQELVTELDLAAKDEFASRSDYIRESILRRLRTNQDRWEVVADFSLVQKGGVQIDELLKRL